MQDFNLLKGGITYSFPIKKIGRFALNYSFKQQLSDFSNLYNGYSLTNYRTLKTGATNLLKSNNSSLGLTHNYQNPSEGFLMFNIFSYSNYNKGYVTQNFISEDFTVLNVSEGKGGELLIAQSQLTQYVDPLLTSLKIENGFNYFINYLSVNSSTLQKAKNYIFSTKLSGTTYFEFPVNLKFSATYQHNRSVFDGQISNVKNYILSHNLIVKPIENVVISTSYNYYNLASNKHFFLSSTMDYKPNKSNWNFQLSAQNLLNVQNFSTTQVNDFHVFEQDIKIIPRYIMLTAHLRF